MPDEQNLVRNWTRDELTIDGIVDLEVGAGGIVPLT
jgi:hypothetical protein